MIIPKNFIRSYRKHFRGVRINRLPNKKELRKRLRSYILKKHSHKVFPSMESVRKQFSPSPGRSLQHLRHIVIDMGFSIDSKDKVISKV